MTNLFQLIKNFLTGAAKKITEALTVGKNIANGIKTITDSSLLDAVVALTPTDVDNVALAIIRTALKTIIKDLGWADKKLSDFSDDGKIIVMTTLSAKASQVYNVYKNGDMTLQQAVTGSQPIYDPKVLEV